MVSNHILPGKFVSFGKQIHQPTYAIHKVVETISAWQWLITYVLIGTAVAAGALKIAEAQLNFIYHFIFYDLLF